jgi:RND superfamily putative drug exporter
MTETDHSALGHPEGTRHSARLFERWGRAVYRWRWPVFLFSLLLSLAVVPLARDATSRLSAGGWIGKETEAFKVDRALAEEFGRRGANHYLLFRDPTGQLLATDPAFQAEVEETLAPLREAPDVAAIYSYGGPGSEALADLLLSADRRSSLAVVTLTVPVDEATADYPAFRERVRSDRLEVVVGGWPGATRAFTALAEEDLRRAELVTLPLTLLLLVLVFGSLVAAGLPLLVGGLAILGTLAGVGLLARLTPTSVFVLNVATMLGLAIAIDYALFLVSRFREELHRPGASIEDALGRTTATAGRAVFVSGLMVAIGVAGLAFFPTPALRSIAIGGALVVVLGVGFSLTALAALLAILGHRVDRLRLRLPRPRWARTGGGGEDEWPAPRGAGCPLGDPALRRQSRMNPAGVGGDAAIAGGVFSPGCPLGVTSSSQPSALWAISNPADRRRAVSTPSSPSAHGFWHALATRVMRRPLAFLIPTLVVLLLAGLPFAAYHGGSPGMTMLPPDQEARQLYDAVQRDFPQTSLSPVYVLLRPAQGVMTDAANLAALRAFGEEVERQPGVRRVEGLWAYVNDVLPGATPAQVAAGLRLRDDWRQLAGRFVSEDAALLEVMSGGDDTDPANEALVAWLRAQGPALAGGAFAVQVGGGTAVTLDLVAGINRRAPIAVGFVVVVTYFILFLLLGSVLLPLKAILMNLLSLTASYGALVWVFQEGHFSGALGFEPLGYTTATVPVMMFCFVFGLSMDYEVLMLTRIKEEYERTGDNALAVARGLEATGRVVTSAALVMVVVFGAFGVSRILLVQSLGVGLALAVALDATLVRALLVPATMRLLGDWNWWVPARLRRLGGRRSAPVSPTAPLWHPDLAPPAVEPSLALVSGERPDRAPSGDPARSD